MKLSVFAFFLLLCAAFTLAAGPEKQIIVSYPENTPDFVLAAAKDAIKQAGGTILHEYHLIKAFAAKAPSKIVETVQSLGIQYDVLIEEDQPVSINGGA